MAMAGELLERYRTQAKLVITSKLHCALPCYCYGHSCYFSLPMTAMSGCIWYANSFPSIPT